ncbi:MAG TPA: hypothetical protein VMN36_11655 [Verrucomicrobiales bacterium]|nr:hypothetical protein [Verrucomicrobiales bacterium]
MNAGNPSEALLDRHAELADSVLDGIMPEDEAVDPAAALVDDVRKEGRVTPGWEERRRLQSILDYWFPLLLKHERIGEAVAIESFDAGALDEVGEIENPYVGLRAFKVEDGPYFFGRDAEVDEACRLLKEGKALLVVGRSGSGKSSFVHAGVAARLQKEKEESGRTLGCVRIHPGPGAGARMGEMIEAWRAGVEGRPEPVDALVVVDQAEEFFTLLDPGVLQNFCRKMQPLRRELGNALGVVLTARQEYEDHFRHFEEECAGDLVRFRLKSMDAAALRAVIVEPAQRVGLRIQEGVVRTLVEETLAEPDGLPLLQFTLSQIWKRRDDGGARRGNTILVEEFQRLGGLRKILQKVSESCFDKAAALGEEERVRRLFVSLFVAGGAGFYVRRRADLEDLEESAEGQARMKEVIACFAEEGLLLSSPGRNGRTQVEVVHESLALYWPRLVEWLDSNREALRAYTEVRLDAQNWTRSGRSRECLITGRRYRRLSKSLEDSEVALGVEEREFLEASAEEERALIHEREERARELSRIRKRAQAMLLACLALAATGLVVTSGFGVVIGQKAKEMAEKAKEMAGMEETKEKLLLEVRDLEASATQLSSDLNSVGRGRLGTDREARLAWERNVRLQSQYDSQRRFGPYLLERWSLKPLTGDMDLLFAEDVFRMLVLDPERNLEILMEEGRLIMDDPSSMEYQEDPDHPDMARYVLLEEPQGVRQGENEVVVTGRAGAVPASDLAPDHKEFFVRMIFRQGEPMALTSMEYEEKIWSFPKPAQAVEDPTGQEDLQERLDRFFSGYFEDLNCQNFEGIVARLAPDGELMCWFELTENPKREQVEAALERNRETWEGQEFARAGDLIVSEVKVSSRKGVQPEKEELIGYRVWVDYYRKAWGGTDARGRDYSVRDFRRMEVLLRELREDEDPETEFRIVSIFSRQLEGGEMEDRFKKALEEVDFTAKPLEMKSQLEPVLDVFLRTLLKVGEVNAPSGKEGFGVVSEDVLVRELNYYDEKVNWYDSGVLERDPGVRNELREYRERFDQTTQSLLSADMEIVSSSPELGEAKVLSEALIAWRRHDTNRKEWQEGVTRVRHQLRVNGSEGIFIFGITEEKLETGGYQEQRSPAREAGGF